MSKDQAPPEEPRLVALRLLMELQHEINHDPTMTLPEKCRHTVRIARSMSKLQPQPSLRPALKKQVAQLEEKLANLQALRSSNSSSLRRRGS